jgi:hypothetical protein
VLENEKRPSIEKCIFLIIFPAIFSHLNNISDGKVLTTNPVKKTITA